MYAVAPNIYDGHSVVDVKAPLGATLLSRQPKSDTKAALREAQRRWLAFVLASDPQRRTLSEIARGAGLTPATLNRFMNKEGHAGVLDALTIRRVAEATGVPPAADIADGAAGLAEEAYPYVASPADRTAKVVQLLTEGRPGIDPWVLRTRALEGAGYFPGDLVILDTHARPRAGDAVCAQVYDLSRMRAETIWRLYEPPYLVAASFDRDLRKPLLVDNDRVLIRGRIKAVVRISELTSA